MSADDRKPPKQSRAEWTLIHTIIIAIGVAAAWLWIGQCLDAWSTFK